ncbi:oxidoreductase [Aspergillus pseudoustus]|uniref:Oxidoreductase n=1 Tax=Aspergillus pseudoustus TaxID=1810923 RepID=A0ABR4JC23_9EURO
MSEAPPPAVLTDRAALTSRTIPSMLLSDGSATSKTPAPSTPIATDAAAGARARFSVQGNAVVTGGAGTLGLRSCDALLEHGLSGLMILDINPTESEKEIEALRAKFPHATIATSAVDVTVEDKVAEAMADTVRILGSIEHLVCFVGVVGCVETLDMPVSQWRRILDINTTGSFICAQAAAREMVKQQQSSTDDNDARGSDSSSSSSSGGGCSITFIASISAHRVNYPQPQAAYNVSKAALLMLKSCLAAEWARYGIRTNTISPGYMDTVLNEGEGIREHRRIWAERNPTGRMGVPAELTGAVVLLASSAGTYINGADIVVDGGGIVF